MTPQSKWASYVTTPGWASETEYLGTLNLRTAFDSQTLSKHGSIDRWTGKQLEIENKVCRNGYREGKKNQKNKQINKQTS